MSAGTGRAAAPPRYAPGQILVKYRHGVPAARKASLHDELGGPLAGLELIGAELVQVLGMSVEEAVERAERDLAVEYAEPNWEVHADLLPDDPRFAELYGLQNTGQTGGTPGADIHAPAAWDVFAGDADLLVGVIDTGVDYTHPDLAANMWTNAAEDSGTAGVDDDQNGYVDDVHGYDFYNGDGDPFDDYNHGTHVAGTIAAVGNNRVGVVGVNWRCRIVAVKFLGASGGGTVFGAVQAIQYAIAVGVKVTNNSWGGSGFSQALLDAITAAGQANQLFVAAAGNEAENTDLVPQYPSAYTSPYILAVAATDDDDQLASFSNFGAASVDIGAPGVAILSCIPGGGYTLLSGTSMATPHTAGVAALLYGRFPGVGNLAVKDLIMLYADPVPALQGRCVTGGRLSALAVNAPRDTLPPDPITDLAAVDPASTIMGLTWTATGDDGRSGSALRTELRYSTSPIDAGNFASATLAPSPVPLPAGSTQATEVSGLTHSTPYYFAIKAFDEFGGAALSNVATGTTRGVPVPVVSALPLVELFTGGLATRTLTLSNAGEGNLDFTIPVPELIFPAPGTAGAPGAPARPGTRDGADSGTAAETRKSAAGRDAAAIQAYGGPDAFEYRWSDSDQPAGPAFEWVDIRSVGTRVYFTGGPFPSSQGPFPLGFDFPFYGHTFGSVRVCAPGFLTLSNSPQTPSDNVPLPSGNPSTPPPLMLAPFWEALDANASGAFCYYYADGGRFIVSWISVKNATSLGRYTFQVILDPSGEIRFQYLSMNDPRNSCTVGIQDATREVGTTVAFNAPYVHNALAVRIFPLRQWLRVAPDSGRIAAGESVQLTVTYDATGLPGGTFDGAVHLLTNAPVPHVQVPASLLVDPGAHLVAAAALDFAPFSWVLRRAGPSPCRTRGRTTSSSVTLRAASRRCP